MALNSSNYDWAPPSYSGLDFSDCGQNVVNLWNYYLEEEDKAENIDTKDVYNAILHALHGYLQTYGYDDPPEDEVIKWQTEMKLVEEALLTLVYYDKACKLDVCPLLGWEGNSDIAGRGMLAAYVIQAILITFYIPALLVARFGLCPKGATTALGRILLAVKHSTVSFMNASLVLGIAMLSASLISLAQRDVPTSSATALMLLMPFSSVLPVALLQLAASNMLRRSRGVRLSWMLITILMIIVLTMSRWMIVSAFEGDDKNFEQTDWEESCLDQSYLKRVLEFSQVFAILLILDTGGFLVGSYIKILQHWPSASWIVRLTVPVWWIAVVTAFLAMWVCLGWFIHFQNKRNSMAGEENKDTEWSFGQILAVGTWVPVVVEFAYIWWEKPLEALNGRLMDPYEVKEISVEAGSLKMIQRRETV